MSEAGIAWDDCRGVILEGHGLWRIIFQPQDRVLALRYEAAFHELHAAGGCDGVRAWTERAREVMSAAMHQCLEGLEEEIELCRDRRRGRVLAGGEEVAAPRKLRLATFEGTGKERGR